MTVELLKILSLLRIPYRSFPREACLSSRISISMTPTSVTLKDKKDEWVTLKIIEADKFNVDLSSGLGSHSLIETDLESALIFALDSLVHEEIRRAVREAHK